MKSVTRKQLQSIVAEAIGLTEHDRRVRNAQLTILPLQNDAVNIVIERMYEYVELSFDALCKISKQLDDTKLIDISDRYHRSGCETCDFGSRYVVNLMIGNIKLVD